MTTLTAVEEIGVHDSVELHPISPARPIQQEAHSIHDVSHEGRISNEQYMYGTEPASETPISEHSYPTGAKLWLTIITIASALILGSLDTNIVATAVPSITDEFHTIADVGWYSSAFRLSTCAFQFMFGKLYKFFPVKRIFVISNGIFLLSSILCATANSSAMFIVGRAVAGVGFAGILSGVNAFNVFPPRRRPMIVGFMCGIESVAVASAPIIGGILTQARGWRWCFWINLPIAGATLLITLFLLPDIGNSTSSASLPFKQKLHQLDLVSNIILIPGLTSLFIALSWAGVKYPWHDGRVIGLLVTFAALTSTFLYNQYRRGEAAVLPPRILKNRSIIAGLIFATLVNSVLSVLLYYLPIYYQVVRGYSPGKSGYMMIPIVVGDSLGAILHGLGTSLWGYYTPFMLISSIGMPIFAGLTTTFDPSTHFVNLIIFPGAVGFSTGIGFMGSLNAARTVLSPDDAALGTSIVLFGSSFGPAVCVAVAQVIFTNRLSTNLKDALHGMSSVEVENNGLTGFVDSFSAAQRADVVAGVSKSLSQTWYLAIALGAATLVGSLSMEWRSVKQKKA